jgi:hypothetical protein
LQHRAAQSAGLGSGDTSISVSQPLKGGVFTVSVVAGTPDEAVRLSEAVVAQLTTFVDSLRTVYVVVPVGGISLGSAQNGRAS